MTTQPVSTPATSIPRSRAPQGSAAPASSLPVDVFAASGGPPPPSMSTGEAVRALFASSSEGVGHELWHVQLAGGDVRTHPAVGPDGRIYVSTDQGLSCVSPRGTIEWETKHPHLQRYAAPLVSGDRVYASEEYGETSGLAVYTTGGEKIASKPRGYAQCPPIEGPAGSLYFGNYSGKVYRVDRDGEVKWERDIGCHVNGEMAMGKNGEVYAIGDPGQLYAFDRDGNPLWTKFDGEDDSRVQTGAGVRVAPDDHSLFAVTWNSHLRHMDADGNITWQYGAYTERRLDELPPDQQQEAQQAGNCGLGSTPVFSPDASRVYVGGMDGKLHAVDRSGHKVFVVDVGDDMGDHNVQVGPDGTVYTSCQRNGTVHAVSPHGQVLWSYQPSSASEAGFIAASESGVYLCTKSGHLYGLAGDALQQKLDEAREKANGAPPEIRLENEAVVINGVRVPVRKA